TPKSSAPTRRKSSSGSRSQRRHRDRATNATAIPSAGDSEERMSTTRANTLLDFLDLVIGVAEFVVARRYVFVPQLVDRYRELRTRQLDGEMSVLDFVLYVAAVRQLGQFAHVCRLAIHGGH